MVVLPSAYNSQVNQLSSAGYPNGTVMPGAENSGPAATDQQADTVSLSGQGRDLSASGADTVQKAGDSAVIQQLKNRDAHVRAHEQAHLAVAGQYAAGPASYTYETGPDDVKYAVGGEVPIDISGERSPEATIQKMEVVRRAAHTRPWHPSPDAALFPIPLFLLSPGCRPRYERTRPQCRLLFLPDRLPEPFSRRRRHGGPLQKTGLPPAG